VAIFHASFHPTQGNTLDWSLKASPDLDLNHVEFSALPSGLHLVEEDVVYFTKGPHHGVCVFRRRRTTEHGHRGFRLSSLGILLAKSARPRPWRHVPALKRLISNIYSSLEDHDTLDISEADFDPARVFFEERKVQRADLGGAGDWRGWPSDLDGVRPDADSYGLAPNPTLHLPHLLRILGPSALTLYKHVLGRRRILIFTLPPVEAACILCQVASDICFEAQVDSTHTSKTKLKGRNADGIKALGMVNLNDMDKLKEEGANGRGWIACTTDAIFLEKPSYYDLLIDLTTSTPSKASRPTLHISRPMAQKPGTRGPSHELVTVRFTWSDVKLWTELNRILDRDGSGHHHDCADCGVPASSSSSSSSPGSPNAKPKTSAWTDVWRLYEDVCVICAGLWMGSWRANSRASYTSVNGNQWGQAREDGDQDLSIDGTYVRNLGMGIEGRPSVSSSMGMASSTSTSSAGFGSGIGNNGGGAGIGNSGSRISLRTMPQVEDDDDLASPAAQDARENAERQLRTTLALLQTFHAHTCFQLSTLAAFLPPASAIEGGRTVVLTPKDILAFELGPLSTLDARFVEWIAEEYAGDTRVVIKRGWKDLLGMVFGLS
ncbi:hypothetical protein PUNSTDRAFT_76382, partial [Punctularia strigosozonata HHB-11173 SS5]